jgi:hypothetical protein
LKSPATETPVAKRAHTRNVTPPAYGVAPMYGRAEEGITPLQGYRNGRITLIAASTQCAVELEGAVYLTGVRASSRAQGDRPAVPIWLGPKPEPRVAREVLSVRTGTADAPLDRRTQPQRHRARDPRAGRSIAREPIAAGERIGNCKPDTFARPETPSDAIRASTEAWVVDYPGDGA